MLTEIFHDEAELARQEDITAQEEMRFGQHVPDHREPPDADGKSIKR